MSIGTRVCDTCKKTTAEIGTHRDLVYTIGTGHPARFDCCWDCTRAFLAAIEDFRARRAPKPENVDAYQRKHEEIFAAAAEKTLAKIEVPTPAPSPNTAGEGI
jgi:hypothetical protein